MSTSTQGGTTKEEILKKHYDAEVRSRPLENWSEWNNDDASVAIGVIAMEEWAEIRAIAFAEWSMTHDIVEGSTPEQMYRQFLQDTK